MAIDDIVRRITEDAANEGASLVAAAEQDSARARDEATAKAEAAAAELLARERALASARSEAIVANARIAARDAMLKERRAADDEVLARAEESLCALPDDDYAAFIARGVASAVKGGEAVLLAARDAARLSSALPAALAAAGAAGVPMGGEAPDIERGVVVQGDRVRVEVSPRAAIAERREELLALADRELFGREG